MFLSFASWLHRTPLSLLFQQNAGWLWPLCEALHFAGLALQIGIAGMFELRLIGAVSLITWFAVLWAGRMLPFIKAGPAARL